MASLFALLFVLPAGLDADDAVDLGDAAHFYGLEVPAEAGIGEEMTVTVHFSSDEPLADDVHIFLHVQSQESTCRMVRDEAPTVSEDGSIAHTFTMTVPESAVCHPQRMEIYTGLYHRGRGGRFRVQGVTTTDDRIHAGYFEIVESGTTEPRAIAPSDMKTQKLLSLAQPFEWWLWGLLFSVLLTIGLRFWLSRRADSDSETGADSDSDAETETETDADADSETDSDSDADSDSDSDADSDSDSESETESDDDDDDPYAEDEDDPERPEGRDPAPEAPPGANEAGSRSESDEESDVDGEADDGATGAGAAKPREAPETSEDEDDEKS